MFGRRPLVSDEMKEWIEDCFDWFDARFEPPRTPILPTATYFSASKGMGPKTARLVMDDIQRHLGFSDFVELVPLDTLPAEYRLDFNAMGEVAGTFQRDGDTPVIQYDPALMARPMNFINTMAHELMHARLDGLTSEVPGGDAMHELATDLGCIIAGFGVFQLQAADDVGWSGYMSQNSRAYALAVFLRRRNLGLEAVVDHLSTRCAKLVRRAFRSL